MNNSVENLNDIKNKIKFKLNNLKKGNVPKIIAVSKTFTMEKILPLVDFGHNDFGENKVQETLDKWTEIKLKRDQIKLHLIGRLQSNKVKLAVKIFDYIHSVDSEKLAKKISDEIKKNKRKIKIFIQVNIGREDQKSGIEINHLETFYNYCIDLNLDVIGLMCIPPVNHNPEQYFSEMQSLNEKLNLPELSMGMSADYLKAVEYSSTFVRIGSNIFGKRD
tara:strand:+ start:1265 stop:1924 length:660 start_codon:yes stop_codon:yes gene_type:complete